MAIARSTSVTATGTAISVGPGVCYGAKLAAGADAATAVIRDGGASGAILAKLSALAGSGDAFLPWCGVAFTTDLHITLTGTSPQLNILT